MTVYSIFLPGAGCGLFGHRQTPQRVCEEGQAASGKHYKCPSPQSAPSTPSAH